MISHIWLYNKLFVSFDVRLLLNLGGKEIPWTSHPQTHLTSPSSQCGHMDDLSLFCFLPLIWLFEIDLLRTRSRTWLRAHGVTPSAKASCVSSEKSPGWKRDTTEHKPPATSSSGGFWWIISGTLLNLSGFGQWSIYSEPRPLGSYLLKECNVRIQVHRCFVVVWMPCPPSQSRALKCLVPGWWFCLGSSGGLALVKELCHWRCGLWELKDWAVWNLLSLLSVCVCVLCFRMWALSFLLLLPCLPLIPMSLLCHHGLLSLWNHKPKLFSKLPWSWGFNTAIDM